jgi:hypothetical protein
MRAIVISFVVAVLLLAILATAGAASPLAAKKFADMDSYDASEIVQSIGCLRVDTKQMRFPLRAADLLTCRRNAGLPGNLRITFRLEFTDKAKTSFTLSWSAPALAPPSDRGAAERAARRVLEAVGVEDADPIVAEFLRDVPMTDESYYRDFSRGNRKITISREACDPSHETECHSLSVGD